MICYDMETTKELYLQGLYFSKRRSGYITKSGLIPEKRVNSTVNTFWGLKCKSSHQPSGW